MRIRFDSTTDAEMKRLRAKRLARLSGKKPKLATVEADSDDDDNAKTTESKKKAATPPKTATKQQNSTAVKKTGKKEAPVPAQSKKGDVKKNDNSKAAKAEVPTKATPAAPAAATPSAAPTANVTFRSMGLMQPLLKGINALGYTQPSPIQQVAIPAILAGKDVLAGAQTGTGKTAAFVLPIIQLLADRYGKLSANPADPDDYNAPVRALILTPTRELAIQINANIDSFTKFATPKHLFSTTVVYGGVPIVPQINTLKYQRPTIIVATPGRLHELAKTNVVHLSTIEFCVLDEADKMLDMGFYPDVSQILFRLPKDTGLQTLLFSATFSPKIRELASKFLRSNVSSSSEDGTPDCVELQVTPANSTVERIQQCYYLVGRAKKADALIHIIGENKWSQVLVFVRTKGAANIVANKLNAADITALAIHGDKSQFARSGALDDFKSGKLRVLVATDVAARGIDISDLPHVINYEIPHVPEDYVHRIGRTGRAGKEGFAVNLVCRDEEGFLNNIIAFANGEAIGNAAAGGAAISRSAAAKLQKKQAAAGTTTSSSLPARRCEIPLKTDIPAEFGPHPKEKAEPIAVGLVTLWGGAGPAPSKSVLHAATVKKKAQIAAELRDRKLREQGKKTGGKKRGESADDKPFGSYKNARKNNQKGPKKTSKPFPRK